MYRCTAQSPFEVQKRKVDSWSFRCPLHYCLNCYEFHGCCDTADLTPCIHCPRAYHTKCIPPGSRFNSMCLLFPRYTYPVLIESPRPSLSLLTSMMMITTSHPSDALPSYKAGTSSSSSNSRSQTVTSYDVFFDQIQVSDMHPSSSSSSMVIDNHFRLPLSLKDSVTHMAATFKMLTRNDYDFMSDKTMPVGEWEMIFSQSVSDPVVAMLPMMSLLLSMMSLCYFIVTMRKGFVPEVCCECTDDCDEDCLNRVLRIECCSSKLRLSSDNGYGDVSICSVGRLSLLSSVVHASSCWMT